MRTFHRNWITYDMAFGRRVCVPHKKSQCHMGHRQNFCCDMLNLFCKHTMNSYINHCQNSCQKDNNRY